MRSALSAVGRALNRVLRPLAPLGAVLKDAYEGMWSHNVSRMAASIAYFGAFSMAPMLVIMVSLASLVFGKSASEGLIVDQLSADLRRGHRRFHPVDAGQHLRERGPDGGNGARHPVAHVGLDAHHRLRTGSPQRHLGCPRARGHRLPRLLGRQARRPGDGARSRLHVPGLHARQHGHERAHRLLLGPPPHARLRAGTDRRGSSHCS